MKKTLLFTNLFFLFVSISVAQNNVSMTAADQFSPATITIDLGESVTWTNNDADGHTTTSGTGCPGTPVKSGIWDSGIVPAGGTFSHTFNTVGTFPYYCEIHCAMSMKGTVVVTSGGVSGTKAPLALDLKLKSFPNPFSESATVEFELSEAGAVKVELYNTLGQKVTTALETSLGTGKHSVNIPASQLKEGLYVCKLFLNDAPAGTSYMVRSGN